MKIVKYGNTPIIIYPKTIFIKVLNRYLGLFFLMSINLWYKIDAVAIEINWMGKLDIESANVNIPVTDWE